MKSKEKEETNNNNTDMVKSHPLPKKTEKELMHITNENLYKRGVISYEVFVQAKAKINRL